MHGLDVSPVVSGENDDGYVIADNAPYLAGGFQSVHFRHFPVDDDEMVIPVHLVSRHHFPDGLDAGEDIFAPDSGFIEHLCRAFADAPVIIDDECAKFPQAGKVECVVFGILQFEGNRYRECRPFTGFAFHIDAAVHHVDNIFGNGHPQAGSLDFIADRVVCTFKWFENLFYKVGRHADSGIADNELIGSVTCILWRQFTDLYVDFPACRCKFQGIARDVQKHLVNTKGVTCDFLMNQIGVYVERQMSGMGLLEDDGTKMFDQFRQDEFLVIQCVFPFSILLMSTRR